MYTIHQRGKQEKKLLIFILIDNLHVLTVSLIYQTTGDRITFMF